MGYIVGANPADVLTLAELTSTGKGFGLGDRTADHLGNEYVWVVYGAGGATVDFAVSINADYTAVMTTNSASFRGEQVGVAKGTALVGNYGWVQIYGRCNVQTDVATVNTLMHTTTTAGQIDDASGAGTKHIVGLVLSTARTGSAGLAPAILNYPTIGATN